MNDIAQIPTDEMVEDYYASKLEHDACMKLLNVASDRDVAWLQERIDGNEKIMRVISAELFRRGESHRIKRGG